MSEPRQTNCQSHNNTSLEDYTMATIKEIAALAGVSRGTVDRVLNNRGAVNPITAEKV